jgi:prepilin-type N-terminal cleavage/methylation domain-containing protein
MLDCKTQKNLRGFSLLEMVLVVAVILILAAVTVPRLLNTVSDISLRYAASDFSGLLQSARIQAVRKNTFYTVPSGTLAGGDLAYYIDIPKAGVYTVGDPVLPINPSITVHQGVGSGAPNEAGFIAGLNFTVNPGGEFPSFNARGLPCFAAAGACPQTPGQGFVIFMSKSAVTGNVPWTALAINPSGRVQQWSADGNGNWIQRD